MRTRMQSESVDPWSNKRGIAMVMVLGLLSVLVILAVAFSIAMHTERAASSQHSSVVRNRRAALAVLADALEALDANLQSDLYPSTANQWVTGWPYTAADLDAFTSGASNLLSRQTIMNAMKLVCANGVASGYSPDLSGAYNGKAAYLIVNLSGLLDANYAGAVPNSREFGANAEEVVLDDLPEMDSSVAFSAARPVAGYDRIYDISLNGGLSSFPVNFSAYSRALNALPDENNTLPAFVGGNQSDIQGESTEVRQAFDDALFGTHPNQGNVMLMNLYDLVDPDPWPGASSAGNPFRTDGPYVDSFPMINEVWVTNQVRVSGDGSTIINIGRLIVEVAYPFVNPLPTGYGNFELRCEFTATATNSTPPGVVPSGLFSRTIALNAADFDDGWFITQTEMRWPYSGTNGSGQEVNYDLALETLEILCDGKAVDSVPDTLPPIQIRISGLTGGQTKSDVQGLECLDCRLNYDVTAAWRDSGGKITPEAINDWTASYMAAGGFYGDKTMDMCVPNRPLKSVGELGYLFGVENNGSDPEKTPAPWETVKLYDHGDGTVHRVVDYFTLDDPATTPVLHGRINPNTEVRDVMATVFNDMPVDAGSVTTRLSWAQATSVADAILAKTATAPLRYVSDLGRQNIASAVFSALGYPVEEEIKREAIFRNTAGLFSTRQNVFAIFIEGKTVRVIESFNSSGQNMTVTKARQRGLAIVWRDPVEQKSFVRWFTWLPNKEN